MKTVLVTGANGFIGKNLCAQLDQIKDIKILRFYRQNSESDLDKMLGESDFVFHLAGINRPDEVSEFDTGNRALTETITSMLAKKDKKTAILLASSTQAELDNDYGKSKSAAEEIIKNWSKNTGNKSYIYRLPGVFGKWCKPYYNSVVATFCHNIVNGKEVQINDPSKKLNLAYIDDVVNDFLLVLNDKRQISADGYYEVPRKFSVTLQGLVDKLQGFKDSRKSLIIPNFEYDFDKFLYATYNSYLSDDNFAYKLDKKEDQRGWLVEFIKSKQGGQIFTSVTKPGFSRGNHWHHTKIEKFLVISGKAEITFKNLYSDDVIKYHVDGEKLRVVDVPPGYVHNIINTGSDDLITLIWANEILDNKRPDTYYLEDK